MLSMTIIFFICASDLIILPHTENTKLWILGFTLQNMGVCFKASADSFTQYAKC